MLNSILNEDDNDDKERESENSERGRFSGNQNSDNPKLNNKNGSKHENESEGSNDESDNFLVQFVIENRKAFEFLKDKNYLSARECYLNCNKIATTSLKDKPKQIDSFINISICDFYNGEFAKSISNLSKANKVYSSLSHNEIPSLAKIHLGVKLFSNYSISNLAVLQTKETIENINTLISIIKTEGSIKKQLSLTHTAIYTLFRIDSLVLSSYDAIEKEESKGKVIAHIIKGFREFLKDQNFEHLLNCFKEASERYKEIKDMNGYYFALFYQFVSLYSMQRISDLQLNEIKGKVTACNKFIIGDELRNEVKEKPFEKIVKEFQEKSKSAAKIYKLLYDLEDDLIKKINKLGNNKDNLDKSIDKSHIFTNEKISSPIFIHLLLRYSLKLLYQEKANNPSKACSNLLEELKKVLAKITNSEIDINSIKLSSFTPEVTNALKQLFDNLIYFYYRAFLRKGFLTYYSKIKMINDSNSNDKISLFLRDKFQEIRTGSKLIKVNFTSKGVKTHFYKIDTLSNSFQIYSKMSDKSPSTSINLSEQVKKIVYGISSFNIKKKLIKQDKDMKNLFEYPWKFLSFVIVDRTIDLFLENNQLVNWYYGLKLHFSDTNIPYKLISTSKFILTKLKLKIVYNFKEGKKNNALKNTNSDLQGLVDDIINEKGIQNISFVKLLLMHNQVLPIED